MPNLNIRTLTIFDVGANRGQSIRFFHKNFPSAKIYAFEPSANTFKILQTETNHISDAELSIFQLGMGEVRGLSNFYESILDETSTFMLPNQKSKYLRKKNRLLFQRPENAFTATTVQTTTVDDFIREQKINQIDILKIDVEGYEFAVLKGAKKVLSDGKVYVIQIERHSDDMRDDNYSEIHEFLLNFSYFIIQTIRHPIGDFYEDLYQKQRL